MTALRPRASRRRPRVSDIGVAVALAAAAPACSGPPTRETVPSDLMGPPAAGSGPAATAAAGASGASGASDQGELILRSAGKDIGRERFTVRRDGDWDKVEVIAEATFPDPMAIDMTLWVDPRSWQLDRYDVRIDRGGVSCLAMQRYEAEDGLVTLWVEFPDGARQLVDREPRAHAQYFIAMRPTLTQTAICARADDQPRTFESFSPWYIVRSAPRAASTVPRAGGKGFLDQVRVDDLIDVYCDGPRLVMVHYAAHAFIAARPEYDAAARTLTAGDPTDELWAGELRCPARTPSE